MNAISPKSARQGYVMDELSVGMSAYFTRIIGDAEVIGFAEITGDDNPLHLDADYAAKTSFKGRIAHGFLSASLISTVIGARLPGPGTIYLKQNLMFRAPVRPGDEVVARITITGLDPARNRVTLATCCQVGDTVVVEGEALVLAPQRREAALTEPSRG